MTEPRPRIPAAFLLLWFAALLAVAVSIRIHGASIYHYNADESAEVLISSGKNLAEVVQFSLEGALHPPLGYFIRHYWLMISDDPSFVRGLSLIFGVATILLYWRIGKKLNGPFTGMCAALLVAFSYGCIVQSYLVRNYTLDLFLLSLSYYGYLCWRTSHTRRALLSYTCFGLLAYLDGFSALFALFCMAAFETLWLLAHKAERRVLLSWVLTNLMMGVFAGVFYAVWREESTAFIPLQNYLHSMLPFPLWPDARLYPPLALGYLLLHETEPAAALLQFTAVVILMLFAVRRNRSLDAFLLLAWLALATGTVLFGSGSYAFLGSRHSLWLFPFLIPPVAWSLSEACGFLVEKCAKRHAQAAWCIAAVLLLLAGWASYDPTERFADAGEYSLAEKDWRDFTRFLTLLGRKDVILMGRGDTYMLNVPGYNPYRYSDNALFRTNGHLALLSYSGTQILYDPLRYDTHPPVEDLPHLPIPAAQLGLLDNVDTLVFVMTSATAPSSGPLLALATCPSFPHKTVMTFPASAQASTLSRDELLRAPITVVAVPQQLFFRQVLFPRGRARRCLWGR